jgi:F0F1-type ATP synthase assembly protein I
LLKQYAQNWAALEKSLRDAEVHEILHGHFNSIISSSYNFSASAKVKLDEILSELVTNFDDEELPLQKQVRLNQLIVEKDGDKNAAQAVMDAEENIFKEKIDFLQMLTNAAFNPEAAGVTKVTQALSVSISQPWIIETYDTFTAQSRNSFPQTADVVIDKFAAITKDGSDEKEQVSKQEKYYAALLQKELSAVSFPIAGVVIGALIGVAGIAAFAASVVFGVILLGIGGVLVWNSLNNVKKKKEQLKQTSEEKKKKAKEVLRGCLAEVVDYRKELATEDAKAEKVRQLLGSITPQDFSSVSQETARNII